MIVGTNIKSKIQYEFTQEEYDKLRQSGKHRLYTFTFDSIAEKIKVSEPIQVQKFAMPKELEKKLNQKKKTAKTTKTK